MAAGRRGAFFSDATVAGTPVRMLTERAPEGGVWQVALPLTDVDSTLTHLKLVLALVCLGGIALAAALGLLVSRAALVPVRRLTGAAERVARTQDLGHRIQAGEEDELGRLAESFNTMLAALERSRLAQRQLVSDASHELRTPLTSVQANLDALAIGEELPARERARILAAAQAQLRELTVLVGDLVDLSKTEVEEIEVEDVRLDLAAAGALERARLHAPECRFVLDAEPCLVRAAPARLDRAIANLLDNACKWNPSPAGRSRRGARARRRAWRCATTARGSPRRICRACSTASTARPARAGRPGSGLGLAIVRQMAETHGGLGARRQRSRRRRAPDARAAAARDDRRRAQRRCGLTRRLPERPFSKFLGFSKAILRFGGLDVPGAAAGSESGRRRDRRLDSQRSVHVPPSHALALLAVLAVIAARPSRLPACGGSSPSSTSTAATEQQAEVEERRLRQVPARTRHQRRRPRPDPAAKTPSEGPRRGRSREDGSGSERLQDATSPHRRS